MKKIKHLAAFSSIMVIISFVLINSSFSCPPPEDEIIGIWISEEDSNWKIIFNNSNQCFWYYNNVLQDTYTYSLETTSPQCSYQVKTGGVEDIYLRLINVSDSHEVMCYEIYGLTNNSLSINPLGLSDIYIFDKQ